MTKLRRVRLKQRLRWRNNDKCQKLQKSMDGENTKIDEKYRKETMEYSKTNVCIDSVRRTVEGRHKYQAGFRRRESVVVRKTRLDMI